MDEMMRVVHSSDSRIEAGKAAKESQDTIYAAGDCCSLQWPKEESAHWFQLRLWGQARQGKASQDTPRAVSVITIFTRASCFLTF